MEPNERIELSSRRYEGRRPSRDIRQMVAGVRIELTVFHAYEACQPTRARSRNDCIDGAPCGNRTRSYRFCRSATSHLSQDAWWLPTDSNRALRVFKPVCPYRGSPESHAVLLVDVEGFEPPTSIVSRSHSDLTELHVHRWSRYGRDPSLWIPGTDMERMMRLELTTTYLASRHSTN